MCGIIGVIGEGMEAARLVHSGLWSLQHRGQESSGIASCEGGGEVRVYKGEGLVAHVYDEMHLQLLAGCMAIGHNRYSTSGGSVFSHIQPVMNGKGKFALVHNGNLPVVDNLIDFLASKKINVEGKNDSELMYEVIDYFLSKNDGNLEKAVERAVALFKGVFCLLIMSADKLIAVRDSRGVRPFSLGKLNGGYVIASETCALATVGAEFVREIEPGEMVVIDKKGLKSCKLIKSKQKLDVFEFVYFARPDSVILGKNVNEVRRRLGINLAAECPIKADVVIAVPDSAIPAALGYSQATGIPFDHGLIKNRYIHRTFIKPAQKLREKEVMMKLNPLPEVLAGKQVILIDDSIVRGTTCKKIVAMIRAAGANKVHLLIASPPVKYPDFYGIDTPRQADLIASRMSVAEIRKFTKADSLYYLSYKGLIAAVGLPEKMLSCSCFNGIYPVGIGRRRREIVANED